jgi:hypothetical protein
MSSSVGTQPTGVQAGLLFLDDLLKDHQLFKSYFNEIIPGALKAGNWNELKSMQDDLVIRLSNHTSIEETEVQTYFPKDLYAEVQKQDTEEKLAVDAFNSVVCKQENLRAFTEAFNKMSATVQKHAEWEENIAWPRLAAEIDPATKERIRLGIQNKRTSIFPLPTRPHPLAGTNMSLPSKIMHPIAGAVDKVVDMVEGRGLSGSGAGNKA